MDERDVQANNDRLLAKFWRATSGMQVDSCNPCAVDLLAVVLNDVRRARDLGWLDDVRFEVVESGGTPTCRVAYRVTDRWWRAIRALDRRCNRG